MAKVEPVQERGMWKCPICGFTAMSRKVVQSHIERTHLRDVMKDTNSKKDTKGAKDVKEEPKKVWDIGGVPVKRVKLYLRTGNTLIGEVVRITKYEIVLKPNHHISDNQIVVFKHAIDYLEVLE